MAAASISSNQESIVTRLTVGVIWNAAKGIDIGATQALLHEAAAEIRRLRRGEFTEEEFQNLCHNFSEDDAERFHAGCVAYQEKLFGPKVET